MNISTFKGQDVYLRSQFQVSVWSLTASAHQTLLAWEKACFCGSCNIEHLVVIPTMILMGKRPIQPKSSLSSHNKSSNKEMYTKVWTAVWGRGLVAAAWPDGTGRRVFCCAEGSGRKERVIDVPFFIPGKKGARWKFFSHVKRQTDIAMLLSHEDSVLVLLFLVVRDVAKI